MTKLYVVWHYDQETMEDDDQEKFIGVYSTEQRAEEAIARLRDKPGFRDFPERWMISPVDLDKDSSWTDGFITVRPGEKPWEETP